MVAAVIGMIAASAAETVATEIIVGSILEEGIIGAIAETIGASVLASGIGMVAGGMASMAVRSVFSPSAPQSVAQAAQVAQGVLLNTSGTIDPINVVYGSRKVGGTLVYAAASGSNNEYLHLVLALGEGEISAINTVYLDNVASSDAKFSGLVTLEKYVGTDAQAASTALGAACPAWDSTHTLAGVAYLYIRLQYSQNVFSSIPTITADVDGKKVYDPRDTTIKFSNNPALCIRDYLINTRYGRGIPTTAIDDTTIIAAANACDVAVAIPGGTQATYTCDGLVNTDAAPLANLSDLLTSCRGFMVFSGGKYKLKLDQADTAGFAFTEDNIIGKWSIKLPEKRNRANRVRATFFDPNNSWQPNIAVQESTTYRTEDNGVLLEAEFSLPYTANLYRAQQIAQQTLKQSRKQTLCQFTATIAGLRCEVGDLVTLTHSTPGWSAKIFRVMRLVLLSSDEVEVTAIEYDAAVYNLDALVLVSPLPGTNLPDPTVIAAPGTPSVAESLYQTTGSAGVKARATVSWSAVPNIFVVDYLPEYRIAAGSWVALSPTAGLFIDLDDMAPGTYEFRLRVRNTMGVTSAYSGTRTKELLGLTAPPATVTGFSVIKSAGFALASWALHADTDVRIGGRIIIRHTPVTSGAAWIDGVIVEEFNGDAVSGTIPLITGTYMAKAKDSSGNYSDAIASFVVTEGMVTGWTTVATSTQQTAFTGGKTNTVVSGSVLQINTLATDATGSYAFSAALDMTTSKTRRFEADVSATSFVATDLIDSRLGAIDTWDSVDGADVNDCDVTLYAATTNDDPAGAPTWSAWMPFFVADFTCRAAKFKLDFSAGSVTHNICVDTLVVHVKEPA